MIERSVQLDVANGGPNASKRAVRPTDLPTENRQRRMRHGKKLFIPYCKNNKFQFICLNLKHNLFQRQWKSQRKYLGRSI